MFVSRLCRTSQSRRRTLVAAGCGVTVLGLVIYFWNDLCLWRAEAQLQQRRHEAAAAWVARSQWFRSAPNGRSCLLQLRIARRRQDFEGVKQKLQQAAQQKVPAREIQRERLLAMAQVGQFDELRDAWPILLFEQRDDGPEIARAYYNWSMLHHELSQAEKALQLWHADYPRDPEPLALSGRFYESQVDWEGAEESYRRAFALAPDNDEIRLAFARSLKARLKTSEAVPLYQEHLRRHPHDLEALRGLAHCEAMNGNQAVAIQLLRRALQQKPDDFATLKALGEALLSQGDAAGAVVVLEQAYRQVPEHANLAYSLARALKECGRIAEAEPLFAFVAESRPKLDQLNALEKQLRKQPDNLELRVQIATLTATYVSRKDAIRWYEALLQVSPQYSSAHAALAQLYRQTGDAERAKEHADNVRQGTNSRHANDAGPTPDSAPDQKIPNKDR